MNHKGLRGVRMMIGVGLGQALLVAGITLLLADAPRIDTRLLPACALIGAGLLAAMQLVADPLVPGAGRGLTWSLKAAAALTCYTGALLTACCMLCGRAVLPPLAG